MAELASDAFTRANSADLGASWDPHPSKSGLFEVLSNAAHITSATNNEDGCETYNAISAPNDQYSEVTLATPSATGLGTGYGVVCRFSPSVNTGYRVVACSEGWELGRFVTGTWTALGSFSTTTFADGDVLRLEVRTNGANCDWTVKKNGSTVTSGTGTDTSPVASGSVGIAYSSASAASDGISAWAAGDFGSASIAPRALHQFRLRR
jgi:hypothetical protein